MGSPFIGEIRIFAGNFAPAGWAFCDGSLVSITEYETLFSLIGTTYGGNGVSTFCLPDLRGRIPMHQGASRAGTTRALGAMAGTETATLKPQHMPAHTHAPQASASVGTSSSPANAVSAAWQDTPYSSSAPTAPLHASALAPVGGDQPHENMPPHLAVNMIISLFGVYPSQS